MEYQLCHKIETKDFEQTEDTIGNLLVKYTGAVQLVRRTEDEVICIRLGNLPLHLIRKKI